MNKKASQAPFPSPVVRASSFNFESPTKAGKVSNDNKQIPVLLRANSFHTVSPIKTRDDLKLVHLIRNRGVGTILKSKPSPIREVVLAHASIIGLVRSSTGNKSGVLISQDLFLTTKHGSATGIVDVQFCDHSGGKKAEYLRTGQYLKPDSVIAKQTGVFLDGCSDFAIIQFAPIATKSFKAAVLCDDRDPQPDYLIHMGCKNGTEIKVSVACSRDVPLTTAVIKNMQIIGQTVLWSNRNTNGIVKTAIYSARDQSYWIQIESKGGLHTFELRNESAIKHFKNGKLSPVKLYLQNPMLIGSDHVIVGHNSGPGSSGGAYFTPDGKLYAIHRGRIHQCLMAGDPVHYFVNHMASMPWKPQTTTFIDSYLVLESIPKQSKQGEHVFNAFGEFVFREIVLKPVDYITTCDSIPKLLSTMKEQIIECIELRKHETFGTASVGCKSNAAIYGEFQEKVLFLVSCIIKLGSSECMQRYVELMNLRRDGLDRYIVDRIAREKMYYTKGFSVWYNTTLTLMDSLFCNVCKYSAAYGCVFEVKSGKVERIKPRLITKDDVRSWYPDIRISDDDKL